MALTAAAQAIIDWLATLPGLGADELVSGQNVTHNPSDSVTGFADHFTALAQATGSWPGLMGTTWGWDSTVAGRTESAEMMKDYYFNGGIVEVHIPIANPWTGGPHTDLTDRDLIELVTPTNPFDQAAHDAWIVELDTIAVQLEWLRSEGVPVLFRPYHEVTFTSAFWWDAGAHPGNPAPYIAMWQYTYNYFVTTKGLNNLLWVYSPANMGTWRDAIDWYPGAAYTHIVGIDVYSDTTQIPGTDYADLVATGKPFALTEHGPGTILDGSYNNLQMLNDIKAHFPATVYFLRWHSWPGNEMAIVDTQNAQSLMDDGWTLNLGELGHIATVPVYKNDANLQARWRFESNGLDETANNNDLTGTNEAYSAVCIEGSWSADLESSLPGYFSILDVDQTGLDITGAITLAAWIRPESIGTSMAVISKYDTSTNNRAYMLWLDSDGNVRCNISSNGTLYISAEGALELGTATWYHIAAVYDGTDVRIYVNAVLDRNDTSNPYAYVAGINNSSATLRVGYHTEGVWPFDGLVDDVLIFNRALSALELMDYVQNGLQDEVTTTTTSTTTVSTTSTSTLSSTSTSTLSTTSTSTVSTTTLSTTSTTTLPPTTPRSFRQSRSLSINIYTPTIGSYTPRGIYNGEIGKNVNAYSHTKAAVGGYLSANFTIYDRLTNLEDWLFGLGRHVEVYNPSLVRIWEGFVNRVTLNIGGLSVVRGPLTGIANKVCCIYSSVDTDTDIPVIGTRQKTSVAQDTTSQGKYGIIEKIISVGSTTQNEAEQIRDTWLEENSEPETSQQFNNQSQTESSASIECLGYVYWLDLFAYNQAIVNGEINVSTQIQNVLAAEPNGLFSTDYTGIDTNILQVNRYTNDDVLGWAYIKALTSRGDSSNNRYTFGIYNDRKAFYTVQPTNTEYVQRLTDPKVRLENLTGQEIYPWNMQPAQWNFYPDFLIGKITPTNHREDPRYEFVESLSYGEPWQLTHSGSKTGQLDQMMSKLGLGGVG